MTCRTVVRKVENFCCATLTREGSEVGRKSRDNYFPSADLYEENKMYFVVQFA